MRAPMERAWKWFLVLTTVCLAAALTAPAAVAANRAHVRKLVFAINLPPSLLNEGSGTIIEYSNRLRKVIRRKTGMDVEWKVYAGWDDVVRAVQRREADFAAMPAYYFAKTLADSRLSLQPLATYMSGESMASPYCVYAKKGQDIFSLDEMLNKTIAVGGEDHWALLNFMFQENNLPFPPADFFGRVEVMTTESAFSALVFNKVDALFANSLSMAYITAKRPARVKIAAIECTSTLTNTLIVRRNGLDPAAIDKIEAVLTNMHKDPDYKEFHRFFKTTEGRWVPSKSTFYSDWEQIVKLAIRENLEREFRRIRK